MKKYVVALLGIAVIVILLWPHLRISGALLMTKNNCGQPCELAPTSRYTAEPQANDGRKVQWQSLEASIPNFGNAIVDQQSASIKLTSADKTFILYKSADNFYEFGAEVNAFTKPVFKEWSEAELSSTANLYELIYNTTTKDIRHFASVEEKAETLIALTLKQLYFSDLAIEGLYIINTNGLTVYQMGDSEDVMLDLFPKEHGQWYSIRLLGFTPSEVDHIISSLVIAE